MKKFDTEVRLAREMTLMDATLIGVGAMIGAGIFVLIGIAAGVAGPALILSFALNGFVALFTAMSYAELGSCYHDAGGGYLWVKEGLPRWNGFLSGWMSWFAHAVACSLYALGFGAYFEHVSFMSLESLFHIGIFFRPRRYWLPVLPCCSLILTFVVLPKPGKSATWSPLPKLLFLPFSSVLEWN
ncbi:MAG: hypothetical protein CO106_04690 [Deltaproteobacteria bacterium CG_4_9_14_3_um_filter_44_9]|nr:MAG: hypothetical protein COS67_04065 [Deltaproteobacteria bacterium CG06_land_8_20_14_3_00_44_19]PIZ20766.1 MAG: hypothetical protein COY50_02985 [Deltaproteobacteria bacterium CG_4_10_14_0_8_um_filter_43_12]PJB43348.1 MAG: hypothetical protein CO106_04690 [Deltaproteobacteria bacterium CG_4_9_14_3_um_filter_44_9]